MRKKVAHSKLFRFSRKKQNFNWFSFSTLKKKNCISMLRKLAKYKTHVEKLQLDIHFTSMAQGLWFRTNWASLSFKKKDIWYQNEKPFFCQQNNNHMWKQKGKRLTLVFGWSVFSSLFRSIQWHFFEEEFLRCFKTLIWIWNLHAHACSFFF